MNDSIALDSDPAARLQSLIFGAVLSRALSTAAHLKVADRIPATGSVDCRVLARHVGVAPAELYRLLRALAANGVFVEGPEGHIGHNDVSRLLQVEHPHSMHAVASMSALPAMEAAWQQWPAALLANKAPFEMANGMPLFAYLKAHRDHAQAFNQAMVEMTRPLADALVRRLPTLAEAQAVCDVGGGLGQLLAALLHAHAHLQGAVFDLPEMGGASLDYLTGQGLTGRARFEGGSFLTALPSGFDVYLIKNVLWNWSDADATQILHNIATVLGNGKLVVVESLITPQAAAQATLYDVMMHVIPHGRARDVAEMGALCAAAGLKIARTIALTPRETALEIVRE